MMREGQGTWICCLILLPFSPARGQGRVGGAAWGFSLSQSGSESCYIVLVLHFRGNDVWAMPARWVLKKA